MCICFLDGGVTGVSSQGAAPPPPSCRSPAAAILECWMWRGEAGTGDESSGERGVGQERGEKKKKSTNFNYAFIYKRNKGLFAGHRQRVLPGKPTEIFLPSSGASQCK